MKRGWFRMVFLSGLLVGSVACSDRDKRLNEAEAVSYKRSLILAQMGAGEISPEHAHDLMRDQARTRTEIDRVYEAYRREHAEERERQRSELENELRGVETPEAALEKARRRLSRPPGEEGGESEDALESGVREAEDP